MTEPYYAGTTDHAAPGRQAPIHKAVADLGQAAEKLTELLRQLEQRLDYILSRPTPTAEGKPAPQEEPGSPMEKELRDIQHMLNSCSATVVEIISRLEV